MPRNREIIAAQNLYDLKRARAQIDATTEHLSQKKSTVTVTPVDTRSSVPRPHKKTDDESFETVVGELEALAQTIREPGVIRPDHLSDATDRVERARVAMRMIEARLTLYPSQGSSL